MSRPTTRPLAVEDSASALDSINQGATPDRQSSRTASPARWALAGAGAALLLALVELADVNVQLTPVFNGFADRLAFAAYFSINLLVGALVGLLAGLGVYAAARLRGLIERLLARGREPRRWHRMAAGGFVCGVAAILLKQQPHLHGFMIGMIREAEKVPALTVTLLNHERATSYLMMMGFVVFGVLLHAASRRAGAMGRVWRAAWMLSLAAILGVVYYVDSRVEVQKYEPTLHRLMFVLAQFFAFALAASVYFSSGRLRDFVARRRGLFVALAALALAGVVFTFSRFDGDHNLKTQIFYRTTQAKQHVKLAQWALDFDRDGYAALLGGGDADDRNGRINPGEEEIVGDGVDNNASAAS